MSELNNIPDDELLKLISGTQSSGDVSGLSDDELLTAINGRADYAPIPTPSVGPREDLSFTGAILPFSSDKMGRNSFDSDAGVVGAVKRAVMLPGQAMQGEFDPTSEEAIPRMAEAAAVMSPTGVASRVSGSMFAPKGDYKTIPAKAPTRAALEAAKKDGYQKAGDLGIEYRSQAVKGMADDIIGKLDEKGYISEIAPEVHALVGKLRNPPEGATIRLSDLDSVRKTLGKLAGGPDATKASAASKAQRVIDEFIGAGDPKSIVGRRAQTGPAVVVRGHDFGPADKAATEAAAREAGETITAARGNAAAGFRSDKITGLEDVVDLRAAAANSGRNIDNAARQRLTSLLTNPKSIRGFSPEEQAAIRDIIYGKPTKNAMRYIGNLFGGGGGAGQLFSTAIGAGGGATLGGGPGAAIGASLPMLIGSLGKAIANKMTKAEIKRLDDLVRSRSPLGEAVKPSTVYAPSAVRDPLVRAMMTGAARSQIPQGTDRRDIVNELMRKPLPTN